MKLSLNKMTSLVPIVSYEYTLVEGERIVTGEEWKLNGKDHRVVGPAVRSWQIVEGQPVLTLEVWCLQGKHHRVDGPAYRAWQIVEGRPVLVCEGWKLDGKFHRVDGPAYRTWWIANGQPVLAWEGWYLHGRYVDPKDLHQAASTIRRWFIRHRDRREMIISSYLRKAGMIVFPGFMGLLRRF